MASNKTATKTAAPAPVQVVLPQPAMAATSNPTNPAPVAPAPAVLAASRTSQQQAQAWLAASGNTMPPANLPLHVGPSAPKGKQGGQRWQHGTVQQAACAALGSTATVATVAQWCKQHGATVQGCGLHGAQAGALGNLRFALGAGVLTSIK